MTVDEINKAKLNMAQSQTSAGPASAQNPRSALESMPKASNSFERTPIATNLANSAAQTQPTAAAQPSATTPTAADRINQMYDAQKEANRIQLENAYNQNMSDAQAAQAKIAPQYQGAANDLAVQFERARRNMNTQAANSGINTGAASQMGLSQTNEYLRDFGKLRSEESNAMAESERNMLNLKTQYQNAVAAAAADNDYKRAAALLDEYNNQTNRDMQKAQLLAQYGDFSMYSQLYGPDVAANMEAIWKAQNPDLAYNTGKITADEYKKMTGKYPAGYKKSGGGSNAYYYNPDDGSGDDSLTISQAIMEASESGADKTTAYNAMRQAGQITNSQYQQLMDIYNNPYK